MLESSTWSTQRPVAYHTLIRLSVLSNPIECVDSWLANRQACGQADVLQ